MTNFNPENIPPIQPPVISVTILPTSYWIESDILGNKHIMAQHQGLEPFTYATLYYDYRYTSNGTIHNAAIALALSIGATEPVENRMRDFNF